MKNVSVEKYEGPDKEKPVTKGTFFDALKEALANYPTKPEMLDALSDKATHDFVLHTIANHPTPEIVNGRYVSKDYLLEDYTKVLYEVMDGKGEKWMNRLEDKWINRLEEKWDRQLKELREMTLELKEMNRDSKLRIARLEKEVFGYASL